jgi:SagB-type dehydrogenase family enzyme
VHGLIAPDGVVRLVARPRVEPVGTLDESRRALLRRLAAGPVDVELDDFVRTLFDGGWLTVVRNTHSLEPRSRPPAPPTAVPEELVLSRFAVVRRDDRGFVLESPRSWCDVRLHGGLGALDDLADEQLRRDLCWAGMAVAPGAEDAELRTRQWGTHELWFHNRSEIRPGEPYGGTQWARGEFEPVPGRPAAFAEEVLDLPRPDLDVLRRTDPTLTAVLEDRRSVRGTTPLTLGQLGEFLFRCARTRGMRQVDGVDLLSRPYPAGGSLYELELYPVVRDVTGLAAGMYHYDSHDHCLHLVADAEHRAVGRLLGHGVDPAVPGALPPVLFAVSARVGRVMWKYEAMAYALVLKDVGVLYQTMYLAATAMGLAPCALGATESAVFAEATGLDPLTECAVGGFVLAGPPA